MRGKNDWGVMTRTGFATTDEPVDEPVTSP